MELQQNEDTIWDENDQYILSQSWKQTICDNRRTPPITVGSGFNIEALINKTADISQTTLSTAYSCKKTFECKIKSDQNMFIRL